MSLRHNYLTTTVGRKYIVALTAIVWTLFVLVHMLGNMLLFKGAQAYNSYSHFLIKNPLIIGAEIFLVLTLVIHFTIALGLKLRNFKSNPKNYAKNPVCAKSASLSSRTMAYTGIAILAFIIWHLITFKYGPHYSVNYDGVEMRDIHKLMVEQFQKPFYTFSYVICMVFIGFHLFHGVKSAFQTLGLNQTRYDKCIKCFGYIYAIIVAVGFMSQPLYIYFAR